MAPDLIELYTAFSTARSSSAEVSPRYVPIPMPDRCNPSNVWKCCAGFPCATARCAYLAVPSAVAWPARTERSEGGEIEDDNVCMWRVSGGRR